MKSEKTKPQEEIKGEPGNDDHVGMEESIDIRSEISPAPIHPEILDTNLVEDDQPSISNESKSKPQLQITNNKDQLPDKKMPKAVVYSALFTPAISFAAGALFSFFSGLTLPGIAFLVPATITFCVGAIYAKKYSESQENNKSQQPNELSSRSKENSQSIARNPRLPGVEIESANQASAISQSLESKIGENPISIESISRPNTQELTPSPKVSDIKDSNKIKLNSLEAELA